MALEAVIAHQRHHRRADPVVWLSFAAGLVIIVLTLLFV